MKAIKVILSCLVLLLGSVENSLCNENENGAITDQQTFKEGVLSPKTYLVIKAVATTALVAGTYYYFDSLMGENDGNTQDHPLVATSAITNPTIINSLLTEGFAYLKDSVTEQMYKIKLVDADSTDRSFLQDLNSTIGGPCLWFSQKFWDVCNYYNWNADSIKCTSYSLESTCDAVYIAFDRYYSDRNRLSILEALKGFVNLKFNITND